MKIHFSVLGEPKGKGRPRIAVINEKPVATTPKDTVVYENLILTEYRRQIGNVKFADSESLDLRIKAYYTIPASASKKKKLLMIEGAIRPTKKPDMDNIVKAVADALNGVAYRDDSQIVDCQIRKFYSTNPRLEVSILSAQK